MRRIGLKEALDRLGADRFDSYSASDIVASLDYVMGTPAMIGDFTGETYKLVPSSEGKYQGAVLTGLPAAQALIGKARWLMRVAIATVTGADTHREAEKAAPVRVHIGKKTLSLGLVELVFGSSTERWSGLLTVEVVPLALDKSSFYTRFDESLGPVRAVVKAREWMSSSFFYNSERGGTWGLSRRGSYVPRHPAGGNRYNSLLGVGSWIARLDGMTVFIPYDRKEERFKLVDPHGVGKVLKGFRLTIRLDRDRLGLVVEADRERSEWAVRLGALSLLAVPVILGLGKGANRGFGRFYPATEKDYVLNDDYYETPLRVLASGGSDMARKVVGFLAEAAKHAVGVNQSRRSDPGKIPVLPVDDYSGYVDSVASGNRGVEEVLGIIGYSATKASWKRLKYGTLQVSGRKMHSWPLGLPRRGNYRGHDTGYFIDGREEGRRQSMVVAFPHGSHVHVVGFPSGDLVELHDRLVHKAVCNPGDRNVIPCDDKPVREINDCDWLGSPEGCQCISPWCKIRSSFRNFVYSLKRNL